MRKGEERREKGRDVGGKEEKGRKVEERKEKLADRFPHFPFKYPCCFLTLIQFYSLEINSSILLKNIHRPFPTPIILQTSLYHRAHILSHCEGGVSHISVRINNKKENLPGQCFYKGTVTQ